MMPARRAAWSGSPFFTSPRRICASASADMAIEPRAIASRAVTALAPTSTIRTRPRASTCDNRGLRAIFVAVREVERQALERDGQIDALQLHAARHPQRPGREVQHR